MAEKYGWTWFGPEDDPDERGTAWIEIGSLNKNGYLNGDPLCEIICRNYEQVKLEHPEWIEAKEAYATRIASALTMQAQIQEALATKPTPIEELLDEETLAILRADDADDREELLLSLIAPKDAKEQHRRRLDLISEVVLLRMLVRGMAEALEAEHAWPVETHDLYLRWVKQYGR